MKTVDVAAAVAAVGPADFVGPYGASWRAEPFAGGTQLGAWLLYAPLAHAFWDWHTLLLVTLEDMPGVEPATRYAPGARFELLVLAIDPERPPTSPAGPFVPMMPPDVLVQFGGELDTIGAVALAERLGRRCAMGSLVPDSDWQRHWIAVVRELAPDAVGPPGRTPR